MAQLSLSECSSTVPSFPRPPAIAKGMNMETISLRALSLKDMQKLGGRYAPGFPQS